MTGSWVPQMVGPLGATKAEGTGRVLGKPGLDPLTILIRESAQNSWDAKDPELEGPVHFVVELLRLGRDRTALWRELFREDANMEGVPIAAKLYEPDPWLLTIGDRGTVGLAGPTRADLQREDEPRNYTSFVLNSGDTGRGHGGGTYGFGKASFFSASQTRAVLVYSRCRTGETDESRMVGIALGQSHTTDTANYTGRHWWGVPSADGVEPLRDVEADALADRFGLPGYSSGSRGTTIAIVCPDLGDRTPRDAMNWLKEALLWHLWPKMVGGPDGSPEMTFSVRFDGEEEPLTAPEEHPVLGRFVEALRRIEDESADVSTVVATSIDEQAGQLVLRRSIAPLPELSPVANECGLGSVHHVCMMRTPKLVVRYLAGDAPADPSVWYAGVFKAFDGVNDVFAAAEPPTHDDWVATGLQGWHKTLVNATTRRLKAAMSDFVRPVLSGQADSPFVALGAASRYFADLLGSVSGEGAGVTPTGASGGARKPVRLVGDPRWERHGEADVLVQDVDVQPKRATAVEPQLSIAIWGGGTAGADVFEDDEEGVAPVAAADDSLQPRVLAWRGPDGRVLTDSSVTFDAGDSGVWQLVFEPVPDTVTTVALRSASVV